MSKDQWFLDWCRSSLAECLDAQKREVLRGVHEVREERIANFKRWIQIMERDNE